MSKSTPPAPQNKARRAKFFAQHPNHLRAPKPITYISRVHRNVVKHFDSMVDSMVAKERTVSTKESFSQKVFNTFNKIIRPKLIRPTMRGA